MRSTPILILAAALALACGSAEEEPPPAAPAPDVACTLEARPAVTVQPVDRRTGQPVDGGTVLIVRDGLYADTAAVAMGAPPAPISLSAAYERPGTYTVIVRHPEYREWQHTAVVTKDVCHVQTVRLVAELQRE